MVMTGCQVLPRFPVSTTPVHNLFLFVGDLLSMVCITFFFPSDRSSLNRNLCVVLVARWVCAFRFCGFLPCDRCLTMTTTPQVVREKVWSAAREARAARGEDEDEEDGEGVIIITIIVAIVLSFWNIKRTDGKQE